MAKPSSLPRWADVGGGAGGIGGDEPSSGRKDTGWLASERPIPHFFNWWMNLVYLWIVWVDTVLADEYKLIISPASFRVNDDTDSGGAGDIHRFQNYIEWKDGSGSLTAWAPLDVRVGDTIKQVIFYVQAIPSADAINGFLKRTPRAGTAMTTVTTASRTTTGELVITPNHVVLEDNAYTLSMESTVIGGGADNTIVTYIEVTVGVG